MTAAQNLTGPQSLLTQLARWLTLAAFGIAGAFMLFFSAAFALIVVGVLAIAALIAVGILWVRAKITGRPFGPKATMNAQMEELRRHMGADIDLRRQDDRDDGPTIDAHQTPEGWTVER